MGIFYMNQYITDVPDELVEAARIDGCSDFGIFTKIILPVIKPAMASWGAITLIARWNDFFWPLLYLRKQAKYTLMVTISPVSYTHLDVYKRQGLYIPSDGQRHEIFDFDRLSSRFDQYTDVISHESSIGPVWSDMDTACSRRNYGCDFGFAL